MRFEAKNQDHKRAAKMSNFHNTPSTVATFWAQRSAHRLMKKRKRTASDRKVVLDAGSVHYAGSHLIAGTWILFRRPAGPTMLGKVRFATRSSTEQGVLLHIYEFDPQDVMQEDGEGGEYAELSSVMVGGRRCWRWWRWRRW